MVVGKDLCSTMENCSVQRAVLAHAVIPCGATSDVWQGVSSALQCSGGSNRGGVMCMQV